MSAEFLTVGQSVPPIYGIEKATGALRFPADINLPNMLWMKILRSPHAHAKIVEVDTTAAEKHARGGCGYDAQGCSPCAFRPLSE